ncbi:ubiquitin-like protein 4A-B [Acanthaster planci]|uniref:Ubiquitin-like protein 4A-B n=1 Tax=Acanthaster planci TaxID=133434 RepID=A0A8B7ZGE7_ACAPL|nr:ubiquitin-like protein 4A-B [Acanthaster planci]
MILTVKILQTHGRECCVEVTATEPILSVKRMVAKELDVPVHQQRLVFKGKTLSDGQCLCDYNIGPDTKIHLVIRRPDASEDLTSPSRIGKGTALWEELQKLLRKHFTSEDAEKVLEQFKKEFSTNIASLSLDDIERIAMSKLGVYPDGSEAGPSTS